MALGITSDMEWGGNISLTGEDFTEGTRKELRFYDGVNYVGFEAGALSGNQIWVLPLIDATVGGQALLSDAAGVLSWGTPSTSAAHSILSGTHDDAATDAVTRGSIIYGNATPEWDELTISSSIGSALTKIAGTDGTDSGFRTIANFALDIDGIIDHGNLESSSLDDADHNASYYTETEISSINSSTSGSTLMGMASIGGSTFSTVQHLQNLFHSTGWFLP